MRVLAVASLAVLLGSGLAAAAPKQKVVKLKVGPFPIEAKRDREICQAIHVPNVGGMEIVAATAPPTALALFFSLTFLIFPATARAPRDRVPWYDATLFLLAVATPCYFAWHGLRILEEAWDFKAPTTAVWVGAVFWLLVLEGARRAGGTALFVLLLVLSTYPIYAGHLPGPIAGFSLSPADAVRYQTMSVEAILGIPMRVFGTLIIGFIVFGAALQATGGGRFFIDLSMAILGAFRGGPAKVAIVASGLFGSMSGSVVSNVLSTGVVTVPTMRRTVGSDTTK